MTGSDGGRDSGLARPIWLIESKLTIPEASVRVLTRPRLLSILDRAAGSSLVLVSAPAGYGKTVAVKSWIDVRGLSAAWVSLDTADNDPVRLWTYLAAALNRVHDGLGNAALARLRTPHVSLQLVIDGLAKELDRDGRDLVVVLDDVHLIDDDRCLRSIEHASRTLPGNARLALITRSDRRLRLQRLRGQGAVGEVGPRELAFTVSETRSLLVGLERLDLTTAQIRQLAGQTEGWPAGLRLVASRLRSDDDPVGIVEGFSGDERWIGDYLAEEVLDGLDLLTQRFLLRTAFLPRFTEDLCNHILRRDDSRELLERIGRSGLFLISLDRRGGWFRYHQTFREFLSSKLDRDSPAVRADLGRRASEWFEQAGLIEEAIDQADAINDPDRVAHLLVDNYVELGREGRSATVMRLIDGLPEEVVLDQPRLAAIGALLALTAPIADPERRLSVAQRARARHPEHWSARDEATVMLVRARVNDTDVAQGLKDARSAVELARSTAEELLDAALSIHAHKSFLAGHLADAEALSTEVVARHAFTRRPYGYVGAASLLALLAADRADVGGARALVDNAFAMIHDAGIDDTIAEARARMADAVVSALEGRLAEARRSAEAALRIRSGGGGSARALMLIQLARICLQGNDPGAAAAHLAAATELIDSCTDPGRLPSLAAGVQDALTRGE